MDFYTIVTNGGRSNITRSLTKSTILELTSFAVGDGGDGYYDPDIEQTELINETYRGKISKIYVDKEYENRLIVECAIPSDSGGYYIREIGIFDANKNLFAVGRIPESYKPLEEKQLIIDSNISIVSFDYLESVHNQDANAHYRLIDADKVDGYHAGNDENKLGISNGKVNKNFNADMVDGYHAGNGSNNLLVLNENGIVPEENLTPYAYRQHKHPITEIEANESVHSFDNLQIVSGYNVGTTTYVYPPDYYTMNDLLAFIPSVRVIHYSGDVDGNDSLYCTWEREANRIKITCKNSEQRANPQVNWLAFWRKNRPAKYV